MLIGVAMRQWLRSPRDPLCLEPVFTSKIAQTTHRHARLLMKHFSNHMLNRTSLECFLTSLAFFRSLSFLLYTGLSNSDCRQQGKSVCYSVNWTAGDTQLEVLNASTGKRRDSGAPSRLCKHALFTRWIRLYRKVSSPWHAGLECEYFHTIKQAKNSTQKQKYVRNHSIWKTYPDNLPLPLTFWNVQLMDILLSRETKRIDLWKAVVTQLTLVP